MKFKNIINYFDLPSEAILDFTKLLGYIRELLNMNFWSFGSLKESFGLFLKSINFILKNANLIVHITFFNFLDVYDIMITMLSNGASEADTT